MRGTEADTTPHNVLAAPNGRMIDVPSFSIPRRLGNVVRTQTPQVGKIKLFNVASFRTLTSVLEVIEKGYGI